MIRSSVFDLPKSARLLLELMNGWFRQGLNFYYQCHIDA
jgi:hypothetical protein